MAFDAEVVNDLRKIAVATQDVAKANEDMQGKSTRAHETLARNVKHTNRQVDRARRDWDRKRKSIVRTTQAMERHTTSQRAGRAVMGQVNQVAGNLTGSLTRLAPALAVPAAAVASWREFQRRIEETQQQINTGTVSAQNIATGGGFAGQGAALEEAARATQGAFTVEQLLAGANAFKGTAKDADLGQTRLMMLEMQRFAQAGFSDPNELSASAGALVQSGLDVRTAANLAAFMQVEAGRDAPQVLESLRAGLSRFGSDAAPTLLGHLLAADDARGIGRVGSLIDQANPEDGLFDLGITLRDEETPLQRKRRKRLVAEAEAAQGDFVQRLSDEVTVNNPRLANELLARKMENLTKAREYERTIDAAQRERLHEAAHQQAVANGDLIANALETFVPEGIRKAVFGTFSPLATNREDVTDANRDLIRRTAEATERIANRSGNGEGL